MQVSGPAAARADREIAGEMRLGACRESSDLFVADVNPFDRPLAADRIGDAVEAVADDAKDALDPGRHQSLDELIRY